MIAFVRGWGTGDQIPDPPRFINYSAGEYPQQPSSHPARFQRLSSKPPLSAVSRSIPDHGEQQEEEHIPEPVAQNDSRPNGITNDMQNINLQDQPPMPPQQAQSPPQPQHTQPEITRQPFGGVALPGMSGAAAGAPPGTIIASVPPERVSSMGPPPIPPTMTMPEPRVPSRQGPPSPSSRDVNDETDPMARALAELRREPPGPGSIRRGASHRRPESAASNSMRGGINPSMSPVPGQQRMSYQQAPPAQGHGGAARQQSVDMTLSPPAPGHTAAQLARSMDDFQRSASRAADKRGSVNYSNYADDVVGAHPSSRPNSPGPISPSGNRSPSPAMMQAPTQPATHIADEVLSQYHQSFPGERRERERSRSRAGSVISAAGSRPGSVFNAPPSQSQQGPPASPRAGFVGIGAGGGRSPSPGPAARSPVNNTGALGPQSLGIALDKSGGVAHDSMAEAYRRQYQEEQQQRPVSQYNNQQPPRSPSAASFGGMPNPAQRPTSGYGGVPPQGQYGQQAPPPQQFTSPPPLQQQASQYQQFQQPPPQPSYQTHPSYQQQPPPQQPGYAAPGGYPQQPQYAAPPQQQQSYGRSASPAPQAQGYGRSASPAPPSQSQNFARAASPAAQHGGYGRSASPAPQQQQQYGYRAPSPQPQQQQSYNRTPSPQPGPAFGQGQSIAGRSPSPQPNQPPPNTAPTGQWSTTGLPVLFCMSPMFLHDES
jgi:hypothetical protein